MNVPKHSFVALEDVPSRRSGSTKWTWLRNIILNELKPDGNALTFVMPNKKDARGAQSAAQNCRKRRDFRELHSSSQIRTQSRPVDGPNGKWKVWVYLESV